MSPRNTKPTKSVRFPTHKKISEIREICVSLRKEVLFFLQEYHGVGGDTFFTASEAEAFGGGGFNAHLAKRATHARRQLLLHGRDMRVDFWAFGTDSDVAVA